MTITGRRTWPAARRGQAFLLRRNLLRRRAAPAASPPVRGSTSSPAPAPTRPGRSRWHWWRGRWTTRPGAGSAKPSFVLGRARTFDHDPLYGLLVLTEIASRALSPGVNDPGTAINVIHAEVRTLDTWMTSKPALEPEARFGRVSMARITPDDIMTTAVRPILRDGASNVEVCLTVCEALKAILATSPHVFRSAVAATAADLLTRVRSEMSSPVDLRAVERAAMAVTEDGASPCRDMQDVATQ